MSGISAAQYLRKKLGIAIIAKVEDGKTYCVVRQGDKEIHRAQDDVYGTLTWLTCYNFFDHVYRTFQLRRRYSVPPTSAFFMPFDVSVIKSFDLRWYVEEVLPAIKGKTNIEKLAQEYTKFDFNTEDVAEKYEIYDWIVQVFVLLRQMKWDGMAVRLPADCAPRTIMEVVSNLSAARFVTFPPGTEPMIPALKAVFPHAAEVEGVWVCRPDELDNDPFGLKNAPTWLSDIDMDYTTAEGLQQDLTEATLNQMEDASDLVRKVIHNLTTPYQQLTEAEQEFSLHGGNPAIIDKNRGGLGKNKLGGLGKICGVGPIEECIERLATHLKLSLTKFSDEDIYNLAAGRISRMTSEKRPIRVGKTYQLETRN